MSLDVPMPQLGESITEGTLSKWLVREGDAIKKDQPLAEIATDKADSELPSPASGRVSRLLVKEGETVAVKTVLCQIDEDAGGVQPSVREAEGRGPRSSAPPSARAAGRAGTAQGALGALASPGTRREALEQGVDLAGVRGTGERGRITREDVLRASAQQDRSWSTLVEAPPHTEVPYSSRTLQGPGPAPALARGGSEPPPRNAREDAVRTSPVRGQASTAAPVRIAAGQTPGASGFTPPVPGVGFGSFKVPPYKPSEGDQVVPFTRRRRITADHMTYSKVVSPHVVTVAEVDLHKTSLLREQHKDRYKKEGHSLTMLAFVTVAAAKALREHPQLNSRVLDDAYVIFGDIHIGVAVDSPDGLVVPVVRRADELGVRGIVRAIDDLAKRARSGKITADDLSGATFSITNPGIKGNLFGGAIINQPNAGILRMGEIQKRVVVVESDGEDRMAIHPVMYLALSYDHRIVDGVFANSFLWRVTELLEQGDFLV